MDILKIVQKRMEELGLTAYALADKLKGDVPYRSVYNFVKEGRSPKLEVLAAVLNVLKLELKPKQP